MQAICFPPTTSVPPKPPSPEAGTPPAGGDCFQRIIDDLPADEVETSGGALPGDVAGSAPGKPGHTDADLPDDGIEGETADPQAATDTLASMVMGPPPPFWPIAPLVGVCASAVPDQQAVAVGVIVAQPMVSVPQTTQTVPDPEVLQTVGARVPGLRIPAEMAIVPAASLPAVIGEPPVLRPATGETTDTGMATDPEDPNTISLPRPPVAAIPTIPPRMQAVTTEPALPNWFVQNATQTATPPIAMEMPSDSAPENPDMKVGAPTPALPDQPLLQQPGAQADLPDLAIASQAPDGAIPAVPAIGVHQTHATPLSTATIPTGHFLPPTLAADLHAIIARRADGPVELSLAPAELGRLHVSLLQDGDILRVVIRAERGETLDLLRRNADSLMQEIRSAGFAGGSFSFSGWTGGQPPAPQAGMFGAGPTADSGQQAAAPPTPEMRPARSGLDLRL